MSKPLILMILDGFGIGEDNEKSNAIFAAKTPNLDEIFKNNPTALIKASGIDVGLPCGQMGNSEVGHTNIGAGRIVYQELTRITKSIEDGTFYADREINDALEYAKREGTKVHIMGLLSDGGVHSHNSHLYVLMDMVKRHGINDLCVHAWLDGRDVPPKSAKKYIKECEEEIEKLGIGEISTICGRYYSMDRDNRWDRTSKAYDAIVNAKGQKYKSAEGAVDLSYENGVTDEFVVPAVSLSYEGISEEDVVICFNFRPDRARQIIRSLADRNFNKVDAKRVFPKYIVCMTQYDAAIPNVSIAFAPQTLGNTFGEYVSKKGLKQLRIAETEKYAHVTFFFNGGAEKEYENEDRLLVPSPKVSTYDLKPEMSAYEVTGKVIDSIKKGIYDVIILNYANCDMVGHTGVFSAAVKAVETVDKCAGMVIDEIIKCGGAAIITADHGNAEKMLDSDGNVFTAHTTNLVPLTIVNYKCKLRKNGRLADIAPTMLEILNLDKPSQMDGESIIKN